MTQLVNRERSLFCAFAQNETKRKISLLFRTRTVIALFFFLAPGDVILSINGKSMEEVEHKQLVEFIQSAGDTMRYCGPITNGQVCFPF